jgi:hypothetical protein
LGGTGFILGSLDFHGFPVVSPTSGDNRIAAWAWTGLSALNSKGCATCSSAIRFSGQRFSGVDRYYDPEVTQNGFQASLGAQKTGPIPLGDECGAAGLSVSIGGASPPVSCPEGGLNANGDFMTQVSPDRDLLGDHLGGEVTLAAAKGVGAAVEDWRLGGVLSA